MTELKLDSFDEGLNVAVIGASGAIGKAMIHLLDQVAKVNRIYAFSRSGVALDPANKTDFQYMDLLDESSIANGAEQIADPLDLVIITTGILHEGESLKPEKCIKDFQPDHFARIFAINTTGPAMVAKYFLPKVARNRKNVFAVLSGRVGSISDNQLGGWYAYRASKAALNMIIKTLAIEIARKNKSSIIVGLHPGTVDSRLSMPFQSGVPEGKLFSADFAAEQLLKVIDQLSPGDSGHMVAWDGERLPF
ncbi:SDR family NAD(P)-dependent oxidoreductase [Endozoicomonas sp. SCSIO W0465]|uniref:SDR family NAD(P)-dependent oxidoreductase n=1 Tax=Endozoicomonas sp. SCSIO W0465 TaxID=2918516 RepID=UPI0020750F06|nr:SDR family NAD(P)-dependent oxidoreductase [Endozoicomonas sp. SCSIO W0465]USE34239.1 SDR family NAD(P)-dependent oxidoreductase [Endozoicomonas sp. SCSIO W0465]